MHLPREAISNSALFLTSLTHSTNLIFATEELALVEGKNGCYHFARNFHPREPGAPWVRSRVGAQESSGKQEKKKNGATSS